jgi:hypothetical protein
MMHDHMPVEIICCPGDCDECKKYDVCELDEKEDLS